MPGEVAIPGRAFAPVIVFIPHSGDGCKSGDFDGEWLPRHCPVCGQFGVIGHGRRRRQAHDRFHDWIRVRRGICTHCHCTLTVLPCWCIPGAHYTVPARQEAIHFPAGDLPAEQAAPLCLDPDRVADPSTIRRWLWRRVQSLRFLMAPTFLAWDFRAAARILFPEPSPP